jgi:hypothetical protein
MDLRGGIVATAQALGMDPSDLATIISYETGGTFDPTQPGPRTKWGQHRGLIQFGEPQAKQYGVDWADPLGSQLGPNGAIVKYFQGSGWKPGMGMLDAYSIVNAGGPGRYNASDTAAGGAPGNVRDKVERQMGGHRTKALKLLGMEYTPSAQHPPNPQVGTGGAPHVQHPPNPTVGTGGYVVPEANVTPVPGASPGGAIPASDKYGKVAESVAKGLGAFGGSGSAGPALGGGRAPLLPAAAPGPAPSQPIVSGGANDPNYQATMAALMQRLNTGRIWG